MSPDPKPTAPAEKPVDHAKTAQFTAVDFNGEKVYRFTPSGEFAAKPDAREPRYLSAEVLIAALRGNSEPVTTTAAPFDPAGQRSPTK